VTMSLLNRSEAPLQAIIEFLYMIGTFELAARFDIACAFGMCHFWGGSRR